MNSPVHVIGALFIFGLCALFSRAAAPRLTRLQQKERLLWISKM
jgi:hypothetical protein